MFGSHLSIAGSLANALREAKRLKMDCVQIFTKNQRQWRCPPLTDEQCAEWHEELSRLRWDDPQEDAPCRVVSHNTYLINMASPDPAMWEKSVQLQRIELERCERLGIPCCVAHPGAHLGQAAARNGSLMDGGGLSKDERAGLKRIVKALNRIHRELPGYRVLTCLETTVGSGTNLGYCFEQLAYIRESVRQPERIAFCLDTCHVTAAGYDMSTDEKAVAVLAMFDAICGYARLKVVHVNDSMGALGSRRDRHAHIGEGHCGKACFRAVLNTPELAGVPKILETPKETGPNGVPMDVINIRRLKRLVAKPSTTAKRNAGTMSRSTRPKKVMNRA